MRRMKKKSIGEMHRWHPSVRATQQLWVEDLQCAEGSQQSASEVMYVWEKGLGEQRKTKTKETRKRKSGSTKGPDSHVTVAVVIDRKTRG